MYIKIYKKKTDDKKIKWRKQNVKMDYIESAEEYIKKTRDEFNENEKAKLLRWRYKILEQSLKMKGGYVKKSEKNRRHISNKSFLLNMTKLRPIERECVFNKMLNHGMEINILINDGASSNILKRLGIEER